MKFKDKKVIVTGANRSMGRAMAVHFAKEGADVAISYRSDKAGADETVKQIEATGQHGLALYADFSQMENVANFAQAALTFLDNRIDILVNNAGMLCRESLFELPPEKMQLVYQVNTISPLYLSQLCAKNMVEHDTHGSIINISSIAGDLTQPRGVGYGSSKAAMNKWTKNIAHNLAPHKIRVNAVAPGIIAAGMNQDTHKTNPELWASYNTRIPLGHPGTPDDIMHMVSFLASDEANWITGKIFTVDGGDVL